MGGNIGVIRSRNVGGNFVCLITTVVNKGLVSTETGCYEQHLAGGLGVIVNYSGVAGVSGVVVGRSLGSIGQTMRHFGLDMF